ncbi:MAG TPA: ABC transporter permease [Alphaproteobacteria bacterium]
MNPRIANNVLFRYAPLLLIAVFWEIAARSGIVSELALPPLSTVLEAWWKMFISGELIVNGASSMYRTVAGLGLAIIVGVLLGIFMAWFKPINAVLAPIVEVFYPLPKSALIPVTAIWLGFGDGSKILLIFLGCMIPVTIGAYNGARGSDQALVWSARAMGASRMRTLLDVVAPSALPEILSGVRIALAISFVLLVSSELLVSRQGLGHMIGFLGDGGAYDAMFAAVLTVALLGFLADRAYQMVMRKALQWQE